MSDTEEIIDDYESLPPARFLLANVGDAEDLERYQNGGFHPVHLGDLYDEGRYRIAHKLGYGGFSTVWLAYDSVSRGWVALKIVVADDSESVEAKTVRSHELLSDLGDDPRFVTYLRFFHIQGPNGRHLCLVLPVLGPSAYELSHYMDSRLAPWLARRVSLQATAALADLHSRGLCHGDLTPKNIVFRIDNLDSYDKDGIYELFGRPETGPLETEAGDIPGPEAPRYIVRTLDFFASGKDILHDDVCIIDFDQSFLNDMPPEKLLGIPVEFLAPEVAIGRHASRASDVWALGCTIMRLRSGSGLFSAYDIDSPVDLVRAIINAFGELPSSWDIPLFDIDGKPTKNPKGRPMLEGYWELSLRQWISKIWDYTSGLDEARGAIPPPNPYDDPIAKPYPRSVEHKIWKPEAVCVKGVYLNGYCDEIDAIVEELPKISEYEADLLYDLLSQILRYETTERPSAKDLLGHPWFSIAD